MVKNFLCIRPIELIFRISFKFFRNSIKTFPRFSLNQKLFRRSTLLVTRQCSCLQGTFKPVQLKSAVSCQRTDVRIIRISIETHIRLINVCVSVFRCVRVLLSPFQSSHDRKTAPHRHNLYPSNV